MFELIANSQTTDDLLIALRAVNVALTVVTAAAVGVRINYDWGSLSRGWRVTVIGLASFPASAAYGSFEQLRQGAQPGIRTLLVTIACLVTLLGLWLSRRDRQPPRTTPRR